MSPRKQQSSLEETAALLAHLAAEVRFRREAAGLSREQFAKLASIAPTTVASYESGHRPLNAQFVLRADEILDADGALTRIWERHAAGERAADDYSWYIELERQATAIRTFETVLIPGLLQTEEYARCSLRAFRPALTPTQVERKVQQRMNRGDIFHKDPEVSLGFVVDEAALRRIPNDNGLATDQLARLLEVARLPNVSLGVIAANEGFYACMHGTFTLMSFEDGSESCYLVAADASRISTDHHKIAMFRDAYDGLQSAALSQRQSEELIREALETL